MSVRDEINNIESQFNSDYNLLIQNKLNFNDLKVKYLSRKGLLSGIYSLLSTLNNSEKPIVGQEINNLKVTINSKLNSFESNSSDKNISQLNEIDLTLPGTKSLEGSIHPLTLIIQQIKEIFNKIGFSSVYGTEVDTDYFNFESLNIPKHHPARDMQDTFYIDKEILLRTHTSSSQVHYMKDNNPPIRIISPGRVYRNEDISVRSYCLFHQIEGLYVDKNVSFSDLKSVLNYFARELFGNDVKTRFRPSYFPFTEPSAEMDVYWGLESESDKRITKGTGWLEILGCGMVDPEVFKNVDYDSSLYSGYAFGVGIERIAMLLYGVEDIREFYKGDTRFLGQFK